MRLTYTITPGKTGSGSNDNKMALHIPQRSRTGAPLSDIFVSYPGRQFGVGVFLFCRDAVSKFYALNALFDYL